jgi:hypothetical protein
LGYSNGKLFYLCNEKEPHTEPNDIWKIPAGATLPPYWLRYLGTEANGLTPIHYFVTTYDEAEATTEG